MAVLRRDVDALHADVRELREDVKKVRHGVRNLETSSASGAAVVETIERLDRERRAAGTRRFTRMDRIGITLLAIAALALELYTALHVGGR